MKKLIQYTILASMIFMFIDMTTGKEAKTTALKTTEHIETMEVFESDEWQEALNTNIEVNLISQNNLTQPTTVQVLSLQNN